MDRPSWLIPAAIAAVVVILLGAVGVIVLPKLGQGNPIASVSSTPSSHATGSPRTSPSQSPTGGGVQNVPTYAPASSAPVKAVQICTAANPCKIQGQPDETGNACGLDSCKVEVAVYFTAVQRSVPVSYIIKVFDRCTGQTTDLPGARATTPASGYIVIVPNDHVTVSIPSGIKSAAIVAVTQTPAEAASAPILIGADSC